MEPGKIADSFDSMKRGLALALLFLGLFGCGKDTSRVCRGPSEVLLFNGEGVDDSSWRNLETVLMQEGLCYDRLDGPALNEKSLKELAQYRAMIFPGGFGDTIAEGIDRKARLRIRKAVREHGVSFLGVCAGAWIAVGPEAETDRTARYGFAVAEGDHLDLYLPNRKPELAAIVKVRFAEGFSRSLVWWGGPSTPEWKNGVVARYPTGEPAISQRFSGQGLVLVTGPHPEANTDWYADSGEDPDGLDHDLTARLIWAVLRKNPLPTF